MNLKESLTVSFLLFLKGEFVQTDSFGVHTESVCAPVGSDVTLGSSCKPPDGYTYISMTWTNTLNNKTIADERKDSWIIYRDVYSWCQLTIRNVSETDSGVYYLIFTYRKGIFYKKDLLAEFTVHVTGLQVSIDSDHVTEGQNVTLTCETSCPPPPPTPGLFVWFRNGSRLDPRGSSDRLSVSALSSEGPLRFSCALKGFESIRSPETLLRVSQSDVWYEGAGLITLLILVLLLFVSAALWMMIYEREQFTSTTRKTYPPSLSSIGAESDRGKDRQSLKPPEGKVQNKQNADVYGVDQTLGVTFDLEYWQDSVEFTCVSFTAYRKLMLRASDEEDTVVLYEAQNSTAL